jgi:transposase
LPMKIPRTVSLKKCQYVLSRLRRRPDLTPTELQRRLQARFGHAMRYVALQGLIRGFQRGILRGIRA